MGAYPSAAPAPDRPMNMVAPTLVANIDPAI